MRRILTWCRVEKISTQHLPLISTQHPYEIRLWYLTFRGILRLHISLTEVKSQFWSLQVIKTRKINLRLPTGITFRASPWLMQGGIPTSITVWGANLPEAIQKRTILLPSDDDTPFSKVHWANMGPIWGRQDPCGPHDSPMNLAIWDRTATVNGQTITSQCNSFEYWVPVDFIYWSFIFHWVAYTWMHNGAPA